MEKIQQKKKKKNWIKILLYLIPYLLFVSLGFILGMSYEQRLIYVSVGEALSYTNINIDLNETLMVDKVTENMKPIIWDIRMQNCTKTEKGYCALECYENNYLIPCENFTNDEHFCENGRCSVSGVCPTYYEKLRGKSVYDCITEAENKQKGGLNSSQP